MRVIAGALKGRRLQAPTWEGLRPTSDKLRETLFNILAPRIPGARLVDAYAGTGAVGIEAISRGAAHVVFVERDRRAASLVETNLAHCGIVDRYAIIRSAVANAFETLRTEPPFDIVFLDPPYDQVITDVLELTPALLSTAGIVVVEHARKQPPPRRIEGLERTREVRSGDSGLAFYTVKR